MHTDEIRAIAIEEGKLPVESLSDTTDLQEAGLTSLTRMNMMLAIEDRYGITFPDEMLTKETFRNLQSISKAINSLISSCATFIAVQLPLRLLESAEILFA